MIIAMCVLGWIVCGVLAYGLTLYDYTKTYPGQCHKRVAILEGLIGPFGLLTVLIMAEHYRFRWRP